jgi:hypothetical protein
VTLTFTLADVVVLPAASWATVYSEYEPDDDGLQAAE